MHRILAGGKIERFESELLLSVSDSILIKLAAAADRLRIAFKGNKFDSCSLINAKSGMCSEDCVFCAQSAKHRSAGDVYPLRSTEEILSAAKAAKAFGAGRFCTVTSGGALNDKDFAALIKSIKTVKSEVDIQLDASLGFLDENRAAELFGAGITRYITIWNPVGIYPSVCSTHSYEKTRRNSEGCKSKGVSACCGWETFRG